MAASSKSLKVTSGTISDSSVIGLTPRAAQAYGFSEHDLVLCNGHKDKETLLRIRYDPTIKDNEASIGLMVRKNLHLKLEDSIGLRPCREVPAAVRIAILPVADTVVGRTGSLFDDWLAPYFRDADRPVHRGDRFTSESSKGRVEFMVIDVEPREYALVVADTIIHTEGDPVLRSDLQGSVRPGYDDVGGYGDVLCRLRQLVEMTVGDQQGYHTTNLPRGVLLSGPTGTGKSLMARVLACELGVYMVNVETPRIAVQSSDETLRLLKNAMSDVRENNPAIIILDDIDAMFGASSPSNKCNETAVLLLASFIKECGPLLPVAVIATTNDPAGFDNPAFRRHGLLKETIALGPPSQIERREILRVHTRDLDLDKSIDLDVLAAATKGYVGADIASLCGKAKLGRLRVKSSPSTDRGDGPRSGPIDPVIKMEDFMAAFGELNIPSSAWPAHKSNPGQSMMASVVQNKQSSSWQAARTDESSEERSKKKSSRGWLGKILNKKSKPSEVAPPTSNKSDPSYTSSVEADDSSTSELAASERRVFEAPSARTAVAELPTSKGCGAHAHELPG